MPSIKDIPERELRSAFKWARLYAEWKVRAKEHADPGLDPENLVHDALTDTLSNKRKWNPRHSLTKHLKNTIDSYVSHHYESQEHKGRLLPESDVDLNAIQSPCVSPEQMLETDSKVRALRGFIRQRAPKLLSLLDVVCFKGIPLNETRAIAETLGFDSRNSAQMQKVYRAIRALRKLCEEWELSGPKGA